MKCAYPINLQDRGPVGCGSCMACRINRKREKTGRMLMEYLHHANEGRPSIFCTLTYEDDPEELVKKDVQDWLKRLRHLNPGKTRYNLVGEYGLKRGRPHYHAILYGLECFNSQILIQDTWGHGFTQTDELNVARVQYIAGYCLKKMTDAKDKRLDGKAPEFFLGSRRPAIGVPFIPTLAEAYRTDQGSKALVKNYNDISPSVRFQGKTYPIGEFLSRKLREELDIPILARDRNPKPASELANDAELEARHRKENYLYIKSGRRGEL